MIKLTNTDKQWVDDIWKKINNKLNQTAKLIWDIMPYTTENGKYIASKMKVQRGGRMVFMAE